MGRLRNRMANHVSPYVHRLVEDMVYQPSIKKQEDRDDAFLLAKQLFADTAYNSDSNSAYLFADAIRSGCYDYISPIENAQDAWEEWLTALHSFLAQQKIASKKKQKTASKEEMIAKSYELAKKLVNSLSIVPRVALIELLAQDIERGDFEDISPINEALNHWEEWVKRARQIMKSRNVILDYR